VNAHPQPAAVPPLKLLATFRNRALVTLMLGHFTVDSYVGLLPVLYPPLIGRFQLSLGTVGLVTLAYTGMASISQPAFGLIADRWGTRFTGLALVWTAATFAAIGFAPSFGWLLVVAFASGAGSGAFHPFGALTARGLLPRRGASTAMSIYVTGGTVGVAAGPLIGVVAFGLFGLRGTALMLIPGLAIAAFLLVAMRARPEAARPSTKPRDGAVVALVPLLATIGVMGSRSWTTLTLQAFTPTWYHELGYQPWFYGPLATTLILSSALGTVGCGALADRYGRRLVILGSLLLSVPAVALFVLLPGPLGFLWAVLVGALAASTAPLMLMLAQELMAGRAGLASGLIMGLGFVSGAIGTPITGAVADHFGLQVGLGLQVLVVAATVPVAMLLPTEQVLRRLRQSRASAGYPALATGEQSG
jgi:FSR family fosmidomycin resistance protein-like MFS transporter